MLKVVRLLVSIGFIAWIVNQYFYWHPGYSEAFAQNNRGIFFQLMAILALVVVGASFYRLLHHEDAVVTWKVRPITLGVIWLVFVAVTVSLLFVNSSFATAVGVQQFLGRAASQFGYSSALAHFFSLFLPIMFFLSVVVLLAAGIGYRILKVAQFLPERKLSRMVIGATVGFVALIWLLGCLALFHLYLWGVVVTLGLILLVLVWNSWKIVLKDFLWEKITITFSYKQLTWVWASFLVILITWNAVDVLRAFPIGWDDLGVYMNFPRQIASTGGLIKGFPGQGYMVITGLGYLFTQTASYAMFLSWLGGLLAVWALYFWGRRFLDAEAGVLMAVIMYSLPMVMHQSFADMKIDMPLFFFMIVGIYAIFMALKERLDTVVSRKWLLLAGLILGTALAVKVTTLFAFFAVIVLLIWRFASGYWAVVVLALIHALYWYRFVITPDFSLGTKNILVMISLLIALASAIRAIMAKQSWRQGVQACLVMALGVIVVWLPWGVSVVQAMPTWGISSFVNTMLVGGESDVPQVDWAKIAVDPSVCMASGTEEELGRYIGNETNPLLKYFGLPWDLTMNVNQPGFYVDISFLFLSLIPLLLLFWKREQWPEFWQNTAVFFGIVWYFWLFVSFGVPWYGLAGFLPALLLVVRFRSLAQVYLPGARWWVPLLIVFSLTSTTLLREARLGSQGQLAYSFGIRDEKQVITATNASYPVIIKTLNQEPFASSPDHYIYRIGTFINYFIDKNRERVFDDAQLDTFRCIDGDGTSDARTLDRLRKLNFFYIIYDTNTQTIERDKQGTLHKKVSRFTQFALRNLKVVAPTDPAQYSAGIILFEIPR